MFADDAELVRLFNIDVVEGEHAETFNAAPTQLIRSVRTKSDGQRELDLMKWGLVPFWAKDTFKPLINARAETVTEKSVFKTAVSKRRCLIPTNGYYEWQVAPDGSKQPFFLSLAAPDGQPAEPGSEPVMAMAGIFDWPPRDSRDEIEQDALPAATSAVITRAATDTLGHIHDRMPLFIPKSEWGNWLDPVLTDPGHIKALIESIGTPPIAPRAVGKAVGNVRNDRRDLILPIDPSAA